VIRPPAEISVREAAAVHSRSFDHAGINGVDATFTWAQFLGEDGAGMSSL